MSQTVKKGSQESFRRGRPGQRQQERIQRKERRQRRVRITLSIILAIVLVAFAGVIFWQVQRYNANLVAIANQNSTSTANAKPSATAKAAAHITATAQVTATAQSANLTATAQIYAGTPTPVVPAATKAPDTPPTVSGTPVKLADGLQYIDIKVGEGMPAQSVYNTKVYYTLWVQSTGKKVDSTYDDGGTAFEPDASQGVIQGWQEGLVGMKVGGTRRLIIPPDLAYGDQEQTNIPANSTLIFDVTLVALK